MNNGFLSQEEIDALLGGDGGEEEEVVETVESGEISAPVEEPTEELLSELEKDILGEVGNISMGSASTALSQIIGKQVNITTPVVFTTNLKSIKENFETPNLALDVKYTTGIVGSNLLMMKVIDAAVVANLMMGGDGIIGDATELSEIEISAVSEAMNQMIGSAATSMATMFAREVNISPPVSQVCDNAGEIKTDITDEEDVVKVSFKLKIDELVDSSIMQILPIRTARKIIAIMTGNDVEEFDMGIEKEIEEVVIPQEVVHQPIQEPVTQAAPQQMQQPMQPQMNHQPQMNQQPQMNNTPYGMDYTGGYVNMNNNYNPANVQTASFQPLENSAFAAQPQNIDLILDVPLEVSVVLGRSKMNIKDVLELGTGSLIELDKLTEEPVEVLVNGKKVAYGEVVVVDENFGVRITSIISNEDRIRSLGK